MCFWAHGEALLGVLLKRDSADDIVEASLIIDTIGYGCISFYLSIASCEILSKH